MTSLIDQDIHLRKRTIRRTVAGLGLIAGLLGFVSLLVGTSVIEGVLATGSVASTGKALLATSLMGIAVLMTGSALTLDAFARRRTVAI